MATQSLSTVCRILLVVGLLFTIIGSALMWHFTYTDDFSSLSDVSTGDFPSRESLRYRTCYFFFLWLSCLVTAYYQRPNLMAITAGLLAAIITFNFSFETLDEIRAIISLYGGSPYDQIDEFESLREALQQLAAGCIVNYIGAGLSFIASVLVFRSKEVLEPKNALEIGSVIFVILFNFIGCVVIWQSSSVAMTSTTVPVGPIDITILSASPLRLDLFEATECTTAVGIVFLIGLFCGISHVVHFAAAISAFYNLSILDTYLKYKDNDDFEDDAAAGIVMLWLSAICIVFHCAFARTSSQYLSLAGSSEA